MMQANPDKTVTLQCGIWASEKIRTAFPLTPALSLREREKLIQRWNKSENLGTSGRCNTAFPLPKGEGQGEGEQGAIPSETDKNAA
jgi:hypothetical protein